MLFAHPIPELILLCRYDKFHFSEKAFQFILWGFAHASTRTLRSGADVRSGAVAGRGGFVQHSGLCEGHSSSSTPNHGKACSSNLVFFFAQELRDVWARPVSSNEGKLYCYCLARQPVQLCLLPASR